MKLKKKEFTDLKQSGMTVNEYSTHSFNCPDTPPKISTLMKRSRICSLRD
jgi:hypothetical protein